MAERQECAAPTALSGGARGGVMRALQGTRRYIEKAAGLRRLRPALQGRCGEVSMLARDGKRREMGFSLAAVPQSQQEQTQPKHLA